MTADIMFCAPDRRRAQMACDDYAKPSQWGLDVTWQLGEPEYWFRVEHRVGRGWCVVRRVRGETVEDTVPF